MKNIYTYLVLFMACTPLALAGTDLSPAQATELARQTLSKQTNLTIKNLSVDSAEPMQWPDSSIGCPQPGMNYMQMIIPGYRVTLMNTATGKTHSVHVGAGRAIICDKTASTRSQDEKNLRFGLRWQQTQKAQQLLANRLSVERDKIRIVGFRQGKNNKADPRCKQEPAEPSTQLIELRFNNQAYYYSVINNRLVACN